jgi:hypothetical protein
VPFTGVRARTGGRAIDVEGLLVRYRGQQLLYRAAGEASRAAGVPNKYLIVAWPPIFVLLGSPTSGLSPKASANASTTT